MRVPDAPCPYCGVKITAVLAEWVSHMRDAHRIEQRREAG